MSSGAADHRPDLRLGAALVVVVLGGLGGAVWWAQTVRDRLPDPVARHWGASGAADGFSRFDVLVSSTAALVLVVAVPLALVAVLSRQPVALRRCVGATAAWLTVFMSALLVDSLRGQLDLEDAALAPVPTPGILVGTLGGLVVAAAVAGMVRRDPLRVLAQGPPPSTAPRLESGSQADSWQSGPSGMDTGAAVVAVVAGAGTAVLGFVVSWWMLPIAILVAALLAGMGRVRTTADIDGLSVRVLRWRLLHVALTEVVEADAVDVDPFWEFGGWGLRVDTAGRTGVVTRKGPAVRVRRGDGSEVLVTVDDAAGAAATLNTLAERHHLERS